LKEEKGEEKRKGKEKREREKGTFCFNLREIQGNIAGLGDMRNIG
jgi:hypothetical protein